MLPVKGIIFLGLNALRLLSMVALVLVSAGTIVLMVNDSNTYLSLRRDGLLGDSDTTCDYYPETDVPTTTWGVFWTELNRFWILCLCILCLGSEIGHAALSRLYHASLPILGPSFSTVPLGMIEIMISSSLLSHYLDGFPLVAPWLLFFVGILNFLAGLGFGVRIKLRRSFLRSRRDMLTRVQQPDVEKLEPLGGTMRMLAKNGVGALQRKRQSAMSRHTSEKIGLLPGGDGNVRSFARAVNSFGQPAAAVVAERSQSPAGMPPKADDEVLRWRARQDNLRAEKEQEKNEGNRSVSALSHHYQWNARHSLVVPLPTPEQERDSLDARIQHAQAGMCHDLTSPPRSTHASRSLQRSPSYAAASGTHKRAAGGFKRRTLVLSKMVQQVRRGSVSAAASRYASRKPRMPAMPVDQRAVASVWKPVGEPGPWEEVSSATTKPVHIKLPQASYRLGKANVKNVEVMTEDDGASRYHSLPVAERFAR